jgi:hypothetical protein
MKDKHGYINYKNEIILKYLKSIKNGINKRIE